MDDYAIFSQDPNWFGEDSLSEFLQIKTKEETKAQTDEEIQEQSATPTLTDEITLPQPPSFSFKDSTTDASELHTLDKAVAETSEEDTESKSDTDIIEQKTPTNKRKRKVEDEFSFQTLTEIFLRIIYPISTCMSKNIVVGISKNLNLKPIVVLNHGMKSIIWNETSWESFNKYVHLIECYFLNKVHGKKTCVNIANSDIEIENTKTRGEYLIKFRNLSKHDVKVLLTIDEFRMLVNTIPAINRYIEQLKLSEGMYKNYLIDTIECQENTPILYGPVDVSIYNRLPQEVYLYRQIKSVQGKSKTKEYDDPNNPVCLLIESKFVSNDENGEVTD